MFQKLDIRPSSSIEFRTKLVSIERDCLNHWTAQEIQKLILNNSASGKYVYHLSLETIKFCVAGEESRASNMDAQENRRSASCMLKVTSIIVPRRTRTAVLPQHIRRRQDGGDDEEGGDNLRRVGDPPSTSYILLSLYRPLQEPHMEHIVPNFDKSYLKTLFQTQFDYAVENKHKSLCFESGKPVCGCISDIS
jgi:hypothetical protein